MTTPHETILVVDDEADFANGLARQLRAGFPDAEVLVATSGRAGLDLLGRSDPAVLLTDLRMPDMDGLELMAHAQTQDATPSVILLTAHGTIETAVTALKSGAYDFLTKPVRREDLYRAVTKGLERCRLLRENRQLREEMSRTGLERSLIGETPAMRRLKETIAAVAASDYTVLVRGESGTGKELVAASIHALSGRAQRPVVSVHCPAIPDQLLESELFGHVKGAFTGAERSRKGLFMSAAGGTIVLDEIGDISPGIQTKLLRVLQEHEIRPVGSSGTVKVDVRIIASTNQALEARIKSGEFREDLFYRLNVLTIHTPPLRDRADDIPLLADHFLAQTCREMQIAQKRLSPEAMACLCGREWPGNVRELQNFVRRLAVFCPGDTVEMAHLRLVGGPADCAAPVAEPPLTPYKDAKAHVVDEFTRRYVERLLERTEGNISEAARISGLERVSLQKILRRLGIGGAGKE
jgi:DNA-binding NtrC family response regulator